jgi:F-type H+-transporting ATPase subunit c
MDGDFTQFLECVMIAGKSIAAGLATIGLVGAGAGIGVLFAGFLVSMARNPYLVDELFRYALLGFALTEALGLLAIMMAFLLLFG